jgi:hypothetical protein
MIDSRRNPAPANQMTHVARERPGSAAEAWLAGNASGRGDMVSCLVAQFNNLDSPGAGI